jgi:molybdenum cofactor cytidylyltransferase
LRIVGILLAAGAGARFGGGKLMSALPATSHGVSAGTPLGAAAATHMMEALNDVIAVVRPGDTLLAHSLECTGARVLVCDRAAEGMGVSLAYGVCASQDAGGWIIALGDMPWIAPPTIVAVADALKAGAQIAAPSYRGQRGHPVGFAHALGPLLSSLTGDEGARNVVAARQDAMQLVEVDDPGAIRDVDLRADLR